MGLPPDPTYPGGGVSGLDPLAWLTHLSGCCLPMLLNPPSPLFLPKCNRSHMESKGPVRLALLAVKFLGLVGLVYALTQLRMPGLVEHMLEVRCLSCTKQGRRPVRPICRKGESRCSAWA